jgi:hypothetical protein
MAAAVTAIWPGEVLWTLYMLKGVLRFLWWTIRGCRQVNPTGLYVWIQACLRWLPIVGNMISAPPVRGVIRGVVPPPPPIFTKASWCEIPPANIPKLGWAASVFSRMGYTYVSKPLTTRERWWMCAKQVWNSTVLQVGRDVTGGLTASILGHGSLGTLGRHFNVLLQTRVVPTMGIARRRLRGDL